MIVDASVLIAILREEEDADELAGVLAESETTALSAPNFLATAMLIDSRGDAVARRQLDNLITTASIRIEPFTAEQAVIARAAFRDFGRGSGHPARLSYGGCMSYALAKALDRPLLFRGNDFGHTDVTPAIGQSRT